MASHQILELILETNYRFHPQLRNTLFTIIFGTHTRSGRNFDIFLLIAIVCSVAMVVLESINNIEAKYSQALIVAEWCFTLIFTVEYLTRIYCSPDAKRYAFSFFGLVDFISILPAFLAFLFPDASYLIVIRLIRLLRIFRVLKLFKYSTESALLWRSIIQSHRKILVFFATVAIITTVLGSLMYVVEGPTHGFNSIPSSIYWAIVTVTTVGYGDIVPGSAAGKAIASIAMLLGYAIIAIPTGIITTELAQEMRRERNRLRCLNCELYGHDGDAKHCKKCGHPLPDSTLG